MEFANNLTVQINGKLSLLKMITDIVYSAVRILMFGILLAPIGQCYSLNNYYNSTGFGSIYLLASSMHPLNNSALIIFINAFICYLCYYY